MNNNSLVFSFGFFRIKKTWSKTILKTTHNFPPKIGVDFLEIIFFVRVLGLVNTQQGNHDAIGGGEGGHNQTLIKSILSLIFTES